MNCKPGDLAIVVAGKQSEHIGLIVRVVRILRSSHPDDVGQCGWKVEPKYHDSEGYEWLFNDAHLRPIRPGVVSDEEVQDLYAPKLPEHA